MELDYQLIDCGNHNDTPEDFSLLSPSDYRYYFDGWFVCIFGLIGVIGNILTLCVLSRPKFCDCFHQLLLSLACYDTIFITCGGINYSCRGLNAGSLVFTVLFPYIIYPFSHIGMIGSVFMTFAISIERFLGICYPLKFPPHTRKAWFYILPVTFISVVTNIPRFLESDLEGSFEHDNVTYKTTDLRMSEDFIKYYRTYFNIPFSAVMPFLFMLILNIRIIWDLKHVKAQRFGSSKKLKKEINLFLVLLSIVVAFFILHSPRIIVDVYEFLNVDKVLDCQKANIYFRPADWIKKLTYISHCTTIVNSGINFLIYSFVGNTFRREFNRMLGWTKSYEQVAASQRTFMSEMSLKSNPDPSHQRELT